MENINERFPSRELVGIDDITNARIAVERFRNHSTAFEVADTSFFRILGALSKTANALLYFETEGLEGEMPLVRETTVVERVVESLEAVDDVVTSDTVESLRPNIFAVLRYPEMSEEDVPSTEEMERLDAFLRNWELSEYTLINEKSTHV